MATTDKNQKQLAALPLWRRAAIFVMNTLRWVFRTVMAVVTFVLVVLFLTSAFSDFFSPAYLITPAYQGLFFPLFALVLLGWGVFLMVTVRWKQLIVVAAVFLIGSERLWRYCPIHFGQRPVETEIIHEDGLRETISVDTLRILTYNTHAMGEANLPNVNSKLPVIDLVRESGADIVCLQEYAFSISQSGHHEKEVRSRLSDIYPYYGFVTNLKQSAMGIALYSKYPIKGYKRIDEEKYHGAMAFGEIEYKGRDIALVNCYLQSFQIPNAERAFMHDIGMNFETDSLAHVEKVLRHLSSAFRTRAKQSLQFVDYFNKHKELKGKPLLVMGDLNDTPISFTYNKMRGDLSDAWVDAGLGFGITYNRFPFLFRIDHLFHTQHFKTIDIKVIDSDISDHYPVMATFQLLPE